MAASGNDGGGNARAVLLWLRSVLWRTGLTLWSFPLGALLVKLWLVVPVAFIAAIIWPIVFQTEGVPYRMLCHSNLKQLGTALAMYTQDWDDRLPHLHDGSPDHRTALYPYSKSDQLWKCSKEAKDRSLDSPRAYYGYNHVGLARGGRGLLTTEIVWREQVLVMVDSDGPGAIPSALTHSYAGTPPDYRHADTATCLWLDGHVQSRTPAQLEERRGDTGTLRDFPYWWPQPVKKATATRRGGEE